MDLKRWYVRAKIGDTVIQTLLVSSGKEEIYGLCQTKNIVLLQARPLRKTDLFINISPFERFMTYRQLGLSLKGGFTFPQSLNFCGTTPVLQCILFNIVYLLERGYPLTDIITGQSNVFVNPALAIIGAGFQAGKLAESFESLADFHEKELAFMAKIKKALHYPGILLFLMIGVFLTLNFFLIPSLDNFLASSGKAVSSSFYMLVWGLAGAMGLGAFLCFLSRGRHVLAFMIGQLAQKLPLLGPLIKAREWWLVLHSYKVLVQNHYHPLKALHYVQEHAPGPTLVQDINSVLEAMDQGKSFDQAIFFLKTLQPSIKNLLSLGLRTGDLMTPLQACCDLITQEVDHYSHRLILLIEPCCLLIMGGMMLGLIVMVFGPLYDQLSQLDLLL